ncbi:MAG: hypothetical protein QME35_03760 [Thermoanaerobacteraceae bacterium]|nr:hypothetical protein [Thermoanaerobacteraceae bacterium]
MENNDKPYADYLICLIGTNPLPAFITILKNADKDTKIKLVYTEATENNIGSKNVAENLSEVVKEKISGINIEFIECDKSDTKKIENCAANLIDAIKKDIADGISCDRKRIVLDYSSGTKVMSALFTERFINLKDSIFTVTISYIGDDDKKIFIYNQEDSGESIYIKKVLNKFNLSIEDITRIHGYSLKDKNSQEKSLENTNDKVKYLLNPEFISSKETRIKVDEIYLLNGRLILCFKSKNKNNKKTEYKRELFRFKDIADKLSGNRSEIIYKCNCDEEMIYKLKKDIKSDYEYEIERRITFINENESFQDMVIKKYKNEGGN